MANEYASFYLKDLLALLDETAIEMLKEPSITALADNEDITASRNSNIALHNLGVMRLRSAFRDVVLQKGAEAS